MAAAPRAATAPAGGWPARFDGGSGRAAHERLFTPQLSDAMAALLYTVPAAARYFAKQQLFARIRAETGAVPVARLNAIWAQMLPELGLIPGA